MAEEPQPAEIAIIEAMRQQHIGRLLLNAQRSYSLEALTRLRRRGHDGLSLAHTNVLPHIDTGGTRITALAERAGVTKQAIGNLVAELEAKGYVRRAVDADDRRAVVISFTTAGWAFLRDAYEVKGEIEAEYTRLLGEHGMHELRHLLQQLVRGASG